MTDMLVFSIKMPPTANKIWRVRKGSVPYKSEEYRAWRTEAAWDIAAQRGGNSIEGPCKVEISARRPRANADLDNRIKPILDALQDGGAFANDNAVHEISAKWADLNHNGVFVCVESLRATTQPSKVAA